MKLYRATNVITGEVRIGTANEMAELVGKSRPTVHEAALVGRVMCKTWHMCELGDCKEYAEYAEKYGLVRVCPNCGKRFIASSIRQKCCCDKCAQKYYYAKKKESVVEPVVEPVEEKPKLTVWEIEERARAAGMRYGMYVALNGL